jgi:hypothetical protein
MIGIAKRTTKLGFHVLRLHYTADPDKNPDTLAGKKWFDEARRGMSDARFRQEYEIDYGAMGGQLVFPEFEETLHVVDHSLPFDPGVWTVWLACDPHPRTPHAFVWLGVSRDGEMKVGWSHWPHDTETRLTVKDYAQTLNSVHSSSLGLKPYKKLMDVAAKGMNASEERSYFDAYRDAGLAFIAAKRNRDFTGYELINEALRPTSYMIGGKEIKRPRLTIMRGCGDNDELVYQLKSLRYREWKGTVTDKDAPEEPQDKRRHLIDCVSYILLDKPRFIEKRRPQEPEDDFNLVRAHSR